MIGPIVTPTPIQELSCREAAERGVRLFVKREDLLPYSFGGNKVRIALEFVNDLQERGDNALLMYGDLRSNLCRVLAMLCRDRGIPCLMLATSAEDDASASSFNEMLVRRFGVEVMQCDSSSIAASVDTAMGTLRSRGLRPYYIYGDRTGSGNEGVAARAYQRAYAEIGSWERENSLSFDCLFVPYGTGCTLGGLICGSLEADDEREIVGISISSRTPERANAILDATVRDWYDRAGKLPPAGYADHIHLECGYNCGGYGKRSERVDRLIEDMLMDNSLPLDPTYTGKALRGALDYLRDHDICDKNVLFVHTGGLPLFFDYLCEQV